MNQNLKTVSREKVLLILEWCKKKFGKSKYRKTLPVLRLYKSSGNATFKDKTDGLRGTYHSGKITIYLASHNSLKELCETIIHEYKHYLMNDKEFDMLMRKMKKRGYDYEYLRYNHPHEKRARRMEDKWGSVCYEKLKHELHK